MADESNADAVDPVREEQLGFSAPVIGEAEVANVTDVLESGWVTTGPKTERLEELVADHTETAYAVGTTNGSSALYLAYRALGLTGEVITSPLTFATTVAGIRMAGATPTLADVRPDTLTLDPDAVAERITPDTEAIVPVHYGGQATDMDALRDLAADHDLAIVEDAAPALGGAYEGEPLGSLGDVGCFSFHATKPMTTGEGGMLVTDDDELADRARRLRLAGVDKDAWERETSEKPGWHYDVTATSGKFNMNDIQAAVGVAQFDKLDQFLQQRRELAAMLDEHLAAVPGIEPLAVRDPSEHARQVYTVVLDTETLGMDRAAFDRALNAAGISTSVYYIPIHHHSAFADLGHADLTQTEAIGDRILSLPLHPAMNEDDVSDIVTAVEQIAG